MSEEDYRRKNEKQEKEEKDERHRGEREWDKGEQWSGGDALGPIIWGLIIIFAGLAFAAVNLGMYRWLTWENVWSVIFIGAGLLFVLEVIIRILMPTYRRPIRGRIILAFVALAIGLGGLIGWEVTWPLIIIAVGLAIVIGVFVRPRP
jgi:fatty acid desaturase